MLLQFPAATSEVDLNSTYDAVIVGSGAAGGMAAHVLTTHGLKVLLLEAGKNQDTSKTSAFDAMAVRSSAARQDASRLPRADDQRIQHSPVALRAGFALPEGDVLHPGLGRFRLQQERSSWMRKSTLIPARDMPGCARARWAGRQISGAGWRCAFPITISKRRATTDMEKTGRSHTPTSRPITTA